MGRDQSISLLLMECRYGDGFLDVCKTGNLRSGSFELGQGHGLLTAKLSDEWSPDWFEIVEPPTRRDITLRTPHGRCRRGRLHLRATMTLEPTMFNGRFLLQQNNSFI